MKLLIALLFFALAGSLRADEKHLIGRDAEGLHKAIAEQKAPVVVVNIWATWCLPCRIEFPDFVKLRREWNKHGVEVMFVSTDFTESLASARTFLRQQGVDWPNYLAQDRDEALILSFDKEWTGALPATFIYNRDRQRVAAFHRPVKYEELVEAVRQAGIDANKKE